MIPKEKILMFWLLRFHKERLITIMALKRIILDRE